jgi:hypothetical protein
MAQEIGGTVLGEEFDGHSSISGGNDKQGFPMRQGNVTNTECASCVRRDTLATVSVVPVSASASPSVVTHCWARYFRSWWSPNKGEKEIPV